ncbi:hypothetical protein nACB1_030 [Acinetobacter phage nACB1]|nr:hypothetical protein nACB1_030 [Acinetobacter phage nACB1]
MKVKDLIELLNEFDQEAEVLIDYRRVDITVDDAGYGETPTINLST